MTNTNPFRRVGRSYPLFDCTRFLKTAKLNPLSARADLEAAVEAGHLQFPLGTSEHTHFRRFIGKFRDPAANPDGKHYWNSYGDPAASPDSRHCWQRYQHFSAELPSDDKGFPYLFVLQLLDMLAEGQHPWFASWAQATLEDLFFSIPEELLIEGMPELVNIDYPSEIHQ
jgi:hypothetical protein